MLASSQSAFLSIVSKAPVYGTCILREVNEFQAAERRVKIEERSWQGGSFGREVASPQRPRCAHFTSSTLLNV